MENVCDKRHLCVWGHKCIKLTKQNLHTEAWLCTFFFRACRHRNYICIMCKHTVTSASLNNRSTKATTQTPDRTRHNLTDRPKSSLEWRIAATLIPSLLYHRAVVSVFSCVQTRLMWPSGWSNYLLRVKLIQLGLMGPIQTHTGGGYWGGSER